MLPSLFSYEAILDRFCADRENVCGVISQRLPEVAFFRGTAVGHAPGTCVCAGGKETAQGGKGSAVFYRAFEDPGYGILCKATFPTKIANGGEGRDPNCAHIRHCLQSIPV